MAGSWSNCASYSDVLATLSAKPAISAEEFVDGPCARLLEIACAPSLGVRERARALEALRWATDRAQRSLANGSGTGARDLESMVNAAAAAALSHVEESGRLLRVLTGSAHHNRL